MRACRTRKFTQLTCWEVITKPRRFGCYPDYAWTFWPYSWVGVLARKYGMVVCNERNLAGWKIASILARWILRKAYLWNGQSKTFGDIDIEFWCEPVAPQFYPLWRMIRVLSFWQIQVMLVTVWQGCRVQMVILSRNHDVKILRAGSYAWRLKQRIPSDLGHLSNEDVLRYDSGR